MARTITQIQNEIIAAVQADPTLAGLTSISAVAFWRLITRVVAEAVLTEEQLNDVLRAELEQIAREAVPGTADWLQKRVLEFQYDALSPQVTQVVDGKVTYPVVDPLLRIVTRAAVKEQSNGRVLVKAAKDDGGGGITPLTALELTALEGYLSRLGFVGIPIDTSSLNADRVAIITGEIYYFKQYNPLTVKANVIIALNEYLKNISVDNFNGVIVRAEFIDTIQAVEGVSGLNSQFFLINSRKFTELVNTNPIIQVQKEAAAGYATEEDSPGFTFDDIIVMTPEDQTPNI